MTLKPCRYCGGVARMVGGQTATSLGGMLFVRAQCQTCGAAAATIYGPSDDPANAIDRVVSAWNLLEGGTK